MARHRTPEEKAAFREQAVAMRRAGVGAGRIARELGVGKALVTELLRGEPPPASLRRVRAKDDLREAALALRAEGRTYDEIQAELGCSKSSLSLWLRHLPVPMEPHGASAARGGAPVAMAEAPPDREVARQLREEGWLLREIGEELGVSPRTALVWTSGIPVPPRATHGRSAEDARAMARARWDRVLAEREAERQHNWAAAAARIGMLTDRDLDMLVATAYWCEALPWSGAACRSTSTSPVTSRPRRPTGHPCSPVPSIGLPSR